MTAEATPPSPTIAPPSYPAPQQISAHITLQAPLSRLGKGPGLILVLDHYALIEKSEQHLDPPPLQKWAEEGYAVVQLLVPGGPEDGGEFPLERALRALRECQGFDGGKVGLISYLSRIPLYIEEAALLSTSISALLSYGGKSFTTLNQPSSPFPPQLIHIPGPRTQRRESISLVPDSQTSKPFQGTVKTYRYEDAKADSGWALPADENYHKRSAGIAHTRSLTFLKPLLGGPFFDLEAIWDEHCKYEFEERDVDRTMATMVDQPYVNHIPTMTGGIGKKPLTAFYTNHFIFSNPPDTALTLISRSVSIDRVIDEFIFSFTHTSMVPWLLPGIPPTGRKLSIPFTSVVEIRGDRLSHEHISWDHATALKQAGLLPEYVKFQSEVDGKQVEVKLPVVGQEGALKAIDEGVGESNLLIGETWRAI